MMFNRCFLHMLYIMGRHTGYIYTVIYIIDIVHQDPLSVNLTNKNIAWEQSDHMIGKCRTYDTKGS